MDSDGGWLDGNLMGGLYMMGNWGGWTRGMHALKFTHELPMC